MQETQSKPDTSEQYAVATNASNLRVEMDSERRSQADVLMAAAWSASRVGSALLRLHSEWDSAEHPRKVTSIYIHEMGLLLGKLKALPDVRHQLALQAERWKFEKPVDVTAAVLIWWLDSTCQDCHGVKTVEVKGGRPRTCPSCKGTGLGKIPHGEAGRRLVDHMEDCICRARGSIGRRLHGLRQK